jgi:N-acetylmuramoyl-L-alanine amidase
MKNLKPRLNLLSKTLVLSWITYQGFLPGITSSTDVITEYHLELACVQELLFYEGRGTGAKGMMAVASVVKNRTNLKGFPSTYCGVSRQRFQFSFHGDKHNQYTNKNPYSLDSQAFALAGSVARLTLDDRLVAPFGGSTAYYHTPEVKPSWAKKMKVVLKDKFHVFYSDVKKK